MINDLLGKLIDLENGEMEYDDYVALMADLVKTGMAWSLQGTYGRAAVDLIDAGVITREGEIVDAVWVGEAS